MKWLLASVIFSALCPGTLADGICFILYQMADNDLEYFIREDNYELSKSSVVREESMTTWVYFDHRNYGTDQDISDPLDNVFNSDGSEITGTKPTSSQYIKWDHGLEKMIVERTLAEEQNGDDPNTVFDFVVTALEDCVDRDATEYFIVFSSHGGGFEGFGGDENTRHRGLQQQNADIVLALQSALQQVPFAPDKFDVIGFDACLMQAIGAADEYRDVADHMLASEAVEPGHGWAYDVLTNGNSAVGLGEDIVANFLSQKQGNSQHQTPKTLALVNLAKYTTFLGKWELLSSAMDTYLDNKDPELYTQLTRARSQAIAFESVVDEAGTKRPSAVDIGSFLAKLKEGCVPLSDSNLGTLLDSTLDSYNDMFVSRGNGPGTPDSTGMHVTWPIHREYHAYKTYYDWMLFDTTKPYATKDAPEWLNFLQHYYQATTPPAGGASVCTLGATTTVDPVPGQLLIGPKLSSIRNGGHEFETEVAREVDEVFIEFGVDLTPLLSNRRRLSSLPGKASQRATSTGRSSRPDHHSRHRRTTHANDASRSQRRLADSDYLIMFGGDVGGSYDQSKFEAFWDRNFYVYGDGEGNFDSLYAFDNGGDIKEIPVLYFPPGREISVDVLDITPLNTDEKHFVEEYKAEYGFLSFSTANAVDGVISDGLSLFTFDGSTYSETPRMAGGQIIPVLYTEGIIGGQDLDIFVGGFFSTIIEWSDTQTVEIYVESAEEYLDFMGTQVTTLILDAFAYDGDSLVGGDPPTVDFVSFSIAPDGTTSLDIGGDDDTDDAGALVPFALAASCVAVLMSIM